MCDISSLSMSISLCDNITQGKSFTMPANMTDESEKVNMGCRDALCKYEGG